MADPVRIAYTNTGFDGGTPVSGSLTWLAGDRIYAVLVGGTTEAPPTFAGGTFVERGAGAGGGGVNLHFYEALCTAAGSGSVTCTAPWEAQVWQFRSAALCGTPVFAGNDPSDTLSLTVVNSGSQVIFAMADNDENPAGRTGTPTVTNEVADGLFSGNYSYWGADWVSQAAGTRNYGVTGGFGHLTKVVVEIIGDTDRPGARGRPQTSLRRTRSRAGGIAA